MVERHPTTSRLLEMLNKAHDDLRRPTGVAVACGALGLAAAMVAIVGPEFGEDSAPKEAAAIAVPLLAVAGRNSWKVGATNKLLSEVAEKIGAELVSHGADGYKYAITDERQPAWLWEAYEERSSLREPYPYEIIDPVIPLTNESEVFRIIL